MTADDGEAEVVQPEDDDDEVDVEGFGRKAGGQQIEYMPVPPPPPPPPPPSKLTGDIGAIGTLGFNTKH